MEVQNTEFSKVTYESKLKTLEIHWRITTKDLKDNTFKEEISSFATLSEEYNPKFIFVNAIHYLHVVSIKLQKWHDDFIIPRYKAAGVKKMAFLMPEELVVRLSIEQVFDEDKARENIQFRYFSQESDLKAWLAEE